MESEILLEVKSGIAWLTMNRPEKRNALSDRLVESLTEALRRAESDEAVRVIVLRGAGKDFCAGADLAQLEKSMTASILENRESTARMAQLFLIMRRLQKPIVGAVHGRALAGGAGLASACDLIIASSSASFCYTEVKIGFVPAMVMAIARRNLGEKRAFEILATGKSFGAGEALAIGFINRVCDEIDFETEVERYASEIAQLSPSALMLTKTLLYQIDGMSFEQALEAGVDRNLIARQTPDCQASIRKFLGRE